MRCVALLLLVAVRAVAADVTLVFVPRWAGRPVAIAAQTMDNGEGQVLRVTRLAALVSGVTLTKSDGSSFGFAGQAGYIDAGSGRLTMTLRDVPAGEYGGIAFNFGLQPATNHGDPAHWPAGHSLNPLVNHLHWSWKGGYVFVALEGHWRGLADTADEDHGFSYHIAGDDHLIPVRFAAAFSITGDTTIQFAIELSRVLGGRRLAVDDGSESTHSAGNDTLVGPLVTSIQHSVFWLGSETKPAVIARQPVGGVPSARVAAIAPRGSAQNAHPLAFTIPAGFPAPALPEDNPLTAEGVALGAVLFKDHRLSENHVQSCADCHAARRAFSDHVALSRGADGKPGVRNAMPLFNLAWASSYAWDGSKPRIRDQAIAAMTNPVEMHADRGAVVAALQADPVIRQMFRAAFGSPDVTVERIGLALEQFLLTNVSANSKFDRAARGRESLTEEEKEGFALFMTEYDPARGRRGADCFHCHGGPLFTDYDFKNNGLDRTSGDPSRAGVTHRPEDAGKFKTPSLRNVAVTGPYMHDGRFATLEEVVAHYDHGVVRSPTLDPNLAKHPDAGMKLTSAEQNALVAFLRTLTDARYAGAR